MNLFLLRHGLAVERTIPGFKLDRDRPLTSGGRKRIRRVATLLHKVQGSFDVILTSPYVRARQTAEIVADRLGGAKKLEISEHLGPGKSFGGLMQELNHRAGLESILLVGHEPDLSQLISMLVTGKPGLPVELKKGGLCKLEIGTLRAGHCATLQWLMTPKLCLP